MLDKYISKALRRKRIYRVVPSDGAIEDESRAREIDAFTREEAVAKYRCILGYAVHPLEPLTAVEIKEVPAKGGKKTGAAEWLQR